MESNIPQYGTPEYKAAEEAIKEKVQAALKAVQEAQALSDQLGIGFHFSVTRGMGGSYSPLQERLAEYHADRADDDPVEDVPHDWDGYEIDKGKWFPSSQSC